MNSEKTIKSLIFSILSNFFLALIKFLAGFFGHSQALIADAIESISDVFSSIMIAVGLKFSQKPADENHPYGHGKIEPLLTFITAGILIISAVFIGYENILNIKNQNVTTPKIWTLAVLFIIIVWKEISFRIMLKNSQQTNSSALLVDAWHHRADAISSLAAFVGIFLAIFFNNTLKNADSWAAMIASVIILYNAYKIIRTAFGEIMDEDTHTDLNEQIRQFSIKIEGIIGVEKCFIRKVGTFFCVDMHIVVNGNISVKQGHDIAHELQNKLKKEMPYLRNILIHIEPDFKDFNPQIQNR